MLSTLSSFTTNPHIQSPITIDQQHPPRSQSGELEPRSERRKWLALSMSSTSVFTLSSDKIADFHTCSVSGELVKLYSCYENDGIFVHRNLLEERSSYFKTRIDNGKFGEHGPVAVRFDEVTHEAREMLVGWLYGQPLHTKYTTTSSNLH